ncbi:DUF2917 domain-containing protein [Chitinilyticum litopenaei]|uniref:DUF2917 domain-containing protein n=1 Tax=Chitinilyticum litopenaei TaxID=1121276 RepID=UPI000491724A|nr:DUF2917 domain-containing protein [Chitinilyticum litopenaei]
MLTYLRLALARSELLVAELTAPAELLCESGSLWLSSSTLREDIVLQAGERRQLPRGRLLLEGQAQLRFSGRQLAIQPRIHTRHG